MQITYNDPRFCFTGFWQENGAGELVSYKRVAAVSIDFRGTQIVLQARVDADAKWIIDGAEATPQADEDGFRFCVEEGEHQLKAVLVSPSRMYLRGAMTDGAFIPAKKRPYIHFIGDSITHAYPGYASASAEALGVDYSVTAHCGMALVDGWGWYPLIDGLPARIGMESNYFQLETPDVAAVFTPYRFEYCRQPDLIVIYLGVNDYLTEGSVFRPENPDIFAARYTQFVAKLRQQYPNAPILMLQCHLPDRTIRIDAIAKAHQMICQTMENVYLLDSHLWDVAVSPDKVHPSAEGYVGMTQKLTEVLRKYVKK